MSTVAPRRTSTASASEMNYYSLSNQSREVANVMQARVKFACDSKVGTCRVGHQLGRHRKKDGIKSTQVPTPREPQKSVPYPVCGTSGGSRW